MALTPVAKVSIVVPRKDLAQCAKELARFGWFHVSSPINSSHDALLTDLSGRAYRLYAELTELANDLGLKEAPQLAELLFGGVSKKTMTHSKDWEDLITKVEGRVEPMIQEVRSKLDALREVQRQYNEAETLSAALKLISRFRLDLKTAAGLRRFKLVLTIAKREDIEEIGASLPGILVLGEALTKSDSVLLLAAPSQEADRLEKVLRSFELKPFSIPPDLPQSPPQAYETILKRLIQLEDKLLGQKQEVSEVSASIGSEIKSSREVAHVAYSVLEQMKKAGNLIRFSQVEGFVPLESVDDLRSRLGAKWPIFVEEYSSKEVAESDGVPALMKNGDYFRSFESITLTQGPPRYGETDPTPFISLAFPIFYGVMFGDLGHGLVLLLLGLLLFLRGSESVKPWGTILATAGVSASAVGLIIGEFFGLSLGQIIPALSQFTLLEFVEHAHNSLNVASLFTILQATILMGIAQLSLGFTFSVVNGIKAKEYTEVLISKIPTLTMYVFGVIFGLAFIGAGYRFSGLLSSSAPTPILGIPVSVATYVGSVALVSSLGLMLVGKPVAMKMGKLPKESLGLAVFMDFIEIFLEKIPGFLANTVSYARLAVLLTVHASLLIALNLAWSLGPAALPLIVLGNLGIIMLEGLIVFIQDLRLHVYEWFTKFYEGSGKLFNRIMPNTKLIEIVFEE